jgi:hypothetical protein
MKMRWAAILGLVALPLLAEGTPDASTPSETPFLFDIVPTLWGADIGVGYRGFPLFQGVDSIVWLYSGGAFEQMTYMRLSDGSLILGAAPSGISVQDILYDRWSGRWQLGLVQGLAENPRWAEIGDPGAIRNLMEVFLFYRGRVDVNLQTGPTQLVFLSAIPDRSGLFQNALLLGLAYNDIFLHYETQTREGLSAEISAEWGPSFLGNTLFGGSDYARFNITGRAFLPLLDLSREESPPINSLYLAAFFSADCALGADVPLNIRQTFGGLDPRTGLGWAVRGIDSGSMDTNLKLAGNVELRLNIIDLWGVMPGALVYWDAGYYGQIGEAVASPASGFVSSAGAGIFLGVFNITALTLYGNARLVGVNADGSVFTVSFEFSSHF